MFPQSVATQLGVVPPYLGYISTDGAIPRSTGGLLVAHSDGKSVASVRISFFVADGASARSSTPNGARQTVLRVRFEPFPISWLGSRPPLPSRVQPRGSRMRCTRGNHSSPSYWSAHGRSEPLSTHLLCIPPSSPGRQSLLWSGFGRNRPRGSRQPQLAAGQSRHRSTRHVDFPFPPRRFQRGQPRTHSARNIATWLPPPTVSSAG